MHIKHPEGRIVVQVNHESKNFHTFADGTILKLPRGYNNLNRRETQPVNAIVVSGEGIPNGAEILIGHNSTQETYRITNHGELSGQMIADRIEYYSIPEEQAFFWREGETWHPIKGFATGLRVFKPYKGLLQGIDASKIKDTLYITSGEFKGKVVMTVRASDYQIVFQDFNGRENNIIRLRHYEDEDNLREEIILLHTQYTEEVKKGSLYIGLTASDCKPLKELSHA